MSVESAGFQLYREAKVMVRTGESTAVDVTLAVVNASHSIQVVAGAPGLDSAISGSSFVADSDTIEVLPSRDGNPVLLSMLSAGVSNLIDGGTSRPYDNENTSAIAVNGSPSGTQEYKMDGAANTGGGSGNVAYVPPSGVVSEVKVESFPGGRAHRIFLGRHGEPQPETGHEFAARTGLHLPGEPRDQCQFLFLQQGVHA